MPGYYEIEEGAKARNCKAFLGQSGPFKALVGPTGFEPNTPLAPFEITFLQLDT